MITVLVTLTVLAVAREVGPLPHHPRREGERRRGLGGRPGGAGIHIGILAFRSLGTKLLVLWIIQPADHNHYSCSHDTS